MSILLDIITEKLDAFVRGKVIKFEVTLNSKPKPGGVVKLQNVSTSIKFPIKST